MPLEDLALSFILSSKFVDVVIPGFMEITQVDAALHAARRGPLTEKSREFLCETYNEVQSNFQVQRRN
jgi:aryl-alcohol dehydrogenase-like predicted oxidoreductase